MLWNGKILILSIALIVIFIGYVSFIFLKDTVYESRINFSVDLIPPNYKESNLTSDFKKEFYSKDNFKNWKNLNVSSSLNFKDFNKLKKINKLVLSTKNESLLKFKDVKKGSSYISINSKEIKKINEIFEYATYVSKIIHSKYVYDALEILKLVEEKFPTQTFSNNEKFFVTTLRLNLFLLKKDEKYVLQISPPTIPRNVSPKPWLIVLLSTILGVIIGSMLLIIRNYVFNHK